MQTTFTVNNINLYVETFGDRNSPAVLLIMGLGCQCLNWFPYFYEPIVAKGYYVTAVLSWVRHSNSNG